MIDPKHERHAELTEWIAVDFDPKLTTPKLSSQRSPLSPNPGRASLRPALQKRLAVVFAGFAGCLLLGGATTVPERTNRFVPFCQRASGTPNADGHAAGGLW
jgi:hypothetical protein